MALTVTPGKASATRLGLVKVSTGLAIDSAGNLTTNLSSSEVPNLPASKITTGQLATARGGTGLDSSGVTDGQLLIGQTSDNTFGLAALTAGSGVSITNAGHGITIAATGSGGTCTSVGLSLPSIFSVAGSPVTGAGTLAGTLATQVANSVFSGPASGADAAPTFRALDPADIPSLNASKITAGTLALARGGTNTDGSSVTANTVFSGPSSGGAASAAFRALVAGDIPSLPASQITSGTLALARGGTNADNSSVTANTVWSGPSSGGAASAAYRALVAADIPSLDTAKITSGTLALARLSGITTSQLDAAAGITSAQIAALDAAKITSGTLPLARLSAITTSQLSATAGIVGTQLDSAAAIVSGQITSLAASKITGSGTLPDGVLSSNVPLLNAANTFTALQTATAFAPTGLTGSTAATRYVGGTISGAPASGAHNKGDWAIGQDGSLWICTTAGTPGTWAQVSGGGGSSSPLTTKGDMHTYSTTDARLAVGADGTFLSADSSQATGLAYKFPAGVAGVSTLSTQLSSNVALTSANTYYDGPTLTLTPGTWLLLGNAQAKTNAGAGAQVLTIKLWDGTTAYSTSSTVCWADTGVTANSVAAIVTPTTTTTYKLSAACTSTGVVIQAATPSNPAGNNATSLEAIQLTGAPASGPGALMPAVRCYNSANISVPTSTYTSLTFNTNRYDQGTSTAQHSITSNTSRLTCQQAGIYNIGGGIEFDTNTTGSRNLRLLLNGTTPIGQQYWQSDAAGYRVMQVQAQYQLAVGDYVELQAHQASGGNLNVLADANESPEFWMARIDSGPGAVQPNTKVQLDYAASTDLFSNTSITNATWTDIVSNQTFTVDDANSVVDFSVLGAATAGAGASVVNIGMRIVIDSAGTPITKALGGSLTPASGYCNPFSGGDVIPITGLSAGSHTVKVQIYVDGTGSSIYLRASTKPNTEFVNVRVLERKQSSGPALIPNTKVQLDYAASTDIASAVSLTATTWTDIGTNQTFTVDDSNSVIEIAVGGCVQQYGSVSVAGVARVVIDSGGTPIYKQLGSCFTPATNVGTNFLTGSDIVSLTGLSAGSHTIKLQVWAAGSGTSAYCRAATQTYESLSIRVLERKQAPTPTLNTTARYHQASGTAQSISNATTTVINFDTLDLDTQSLVTTGASWKCTAKTTGNYHIATSVGLASAIWAGTGAIKLHLYKNGSLYSTLNIVTVQVANTDQFNISGTDIVPLVAGDYLDVRLYQNQGGAVALIGDSAQNYVAIDRIS